VRRIATIAWGAAAVAALLLSSCTTERESPTPLLPAPSPSPSPSETTDPDAGPVQPVGEATSIASGLTTPWSIVFVENGSALISERDTALVKERTAAGGIREVGRVADVVPGGEGGLLGLTILADGGTSANASDGPGHPWLYAYFTASGDNRIVRMPLRGEAGGYTLGPAETVLTGLAKAGTHNGGRIDFGPDGMLYATVGDAGRPERSQDPGSLNGKILRMTPTGAAPVDNPIPGSVVYSLGHRNPQGIAWDADGQLWASEFGQNTWDELNRIQAGENYGWPLIEGVGDSPGFVNPEYQWSTAEASPSGLEFTRGTFLLASLRGQRVWAIYDRQQVEAVPHFEGQFGRIRDVAAAPDGTLWILTSNTDRGIPREGDDQIIQVQLAPITAG
jgi:glucose/arabinose dehydrogenase